MFPRTELELDPQLPRAASFWLPAPEDLEEEEGFGYFRDVWQIYGISVEEARHMLDEDQSLSLFTSNLATTEYEFDMIAAAVETGSVEGIEGLSEYQLDSLAPYLTDEGRLDGLEIGVAGLVYCLSAAGMYPAASCRGHTCPNAWSRNPVVLLAAGQAHAEILAPLVKDTNCGFSIDPARAELLVVQSRCVENTLNLAKAVLRNVNNFLSLGDSVYRTEPTIQPNNQPSLFDDFGDESLYHATHHLSKLTTVSVHGLEPSGDDRRSHYWISWAGEHPLLAADYRYRIAAIFLGRHHACRNKFSLSGNRQSERCRYIWIIILVTEDQDALRC